MRAVLLLALASLVMGEVRSEVEPASEPETLTFFLHHGDTIEETGGKGMSIVFKYSSMYYQHQSQTYSKVVMYLESCLRSEPRMKVPKVGTMMWQMQA